MSSSEKVLLSPDTPNRARYYAADGLGRIGSTQAEKALIVAMNSDDEQLRAAGVFGARLLKRAPLYRDS